MGIPDEPFWAPDDLVESVPRRRRRPWRRRPRARGTSRSTPSTPTSAAAWDAAWHGTGTEGVGGRPAGVRARREGRHPPGDRQGPRRRAAAASPASCPGAADLTGNTGVKLPTDAGQQTRRRPRRPPDLLRHPRARHGRGVRRDGDARRRPAAQRHVLRLPRLHAPAGPPGVAARGRRSCSSSATTPSASARTARPTSPSSSWRRCGRSPQLQVIRPADANETAAAWRAAVDHDGPTALVLTRQGVPVCTDGSAVERGAGIVARQRRRPGGRHRRHRQRGGRRRRGRRATRPTDGTAARVVSLPSWDRFAAQDTELPPVGAAARRARAVGRGGDDVRLGALRRRLDRHRPLRGQRSRRRGAAPSRHQRRSRRGASPRARLTGSRAGDRRRRPMERLIRLYEEFGQSPWLDNLKRGYLTSGQLAELRDGGHPRPHVEPDDLPEGDRRIGGLRRAVPRPVRRRRAGRRRLLGARHGRHRRGVRRARHRSTSRATAGTASSASRWHRSSPTTPPAPSAAARDLHERSPGAT